MRARPYPRTKPSGVEWLGDVPEHWDVMRAATLGRFSSSGIDKKWVDGETPVQMFNYLDVYRSETKALRYSEELMWTTAEPEKIREHAVRTGDILITPSSETEDDIGHAAHVVDPPANIVYSYHLVRFRISAKCDARFLAYSINAPSIRSYFESVCSGTTRMVLVRDDMRNARFALPPPAEQRSIAAFLDRETGRVDRLVAKKRELIERLKEKRTALISRTVTRGLPPAAARAAGLPANPPLKPSGIEWLGDIPKHWEARRLKDVGTLKGGAGFPHEEQGLEDEELPFYKVGDLKASLDGRVMTKPEHTISKETARKLRAAIIPPESIVYAKIGAALLLNRRRVTFADCCIDNNMTAYLPDKRRIRSEWAFYWLSILDFGEFMNPGAVPSFSEGYQAILPVLLPPLPEQAAIAAYLDEETAKLDALVTQVEEAVERLQEYRVALITAAVTGKIQV